MNDYFSALLVGVLLVGLALLIVSAADAWDDFTRAQDDWPELSDDDTQEFPAVRDEDAA